MGRKKFYIHKRSNGIFYAELVDQSSGRKMTARSNGETDRDAAMLVVAEWLKNGLPVAKTHQVRPLQAVFDLHSICDQIRRAPLDGAGAEKIVGILKDRGLIVGNFAKAGPSSIPFLDFLYTAWNLETSNFLKEKAAYGHPLTKRHVQESLGVIKRHWDCEKFQGVLLIDLTRSMLKEHLVALSQANLAPATLNKALAAVSAPLGWAAREKLIPENPAGGIPRFTGSSKERGILTGAEIESLCSLSWTDNRAYVGFLVALTCGLRISEVIALQAQDIADDRLRVRHSWSPADGLTCLKNKESREVKVLPALRDALRALVATNPHGQGGEAFVFFGNKDDQPIDPKVITEGYIKALGQIGITNEKRKMRNLVFHGLRHNYATALSERVSEAQAMKATGHKTVEIYKHYSAHQTEESLAAVGAAISDAFGKIVRFQLASGQ